MTNPVDNLVYDHAHLVTETSLVPVALGHLATAGARRPAYLLCDVRWQHVVEDPHGTTTEPADTIEHGQRVVLLRLVAQYPGHLRPFVIQGDLARVVQRAALAHRNLLRRLAGDEIGLQFMPRVRGIAEQAVDRLAAGWQRADMLPRRRALRGVDRHRVTVGEVSTALSGRHVRSEERRV